MANKLYNIKRCNETKDSEAFVKKMFDAGYVPFERIHKPTLQVGSVFLLPFEDIIIYDINNTSFSFYIDKSTLTQKAGFNNVRAIGVLENILKAKTEIEKKTGFVLEEMK